MTLGKIHGEAIADYHATDCVSHTKLECFRRRPALFKKTYIDKTIAREESRAFAIGSALHCMTLEGDAFPDRYVVRPAGIDRRTKDGKAQWETFCSANVGKTILDGDEAAQVCAMDEAIWNHPIAQHLLTGGEAEVTWRAKANTLPHPLQCRTDYFNANGCEFSHGRPYVVDLKTVDSLDSEEFRNFERAFVSFGYHRQCGFYLPLLQDCGVSCWDFYFLVVEKCEPFGCVVYQPNEDAVSRGLDETVSDLGRLAQCYKSGEWPNLPTDVQEIGLPEWYMRRNAA